MSFTSKNLHAKRGGMGFIKWATLFFLWVSCVLFITKAFDIEPITTNTLQYIQKVFLTIDGGNTPGSERISLDGTNGNGTFNGTVSASTVSAPTVCLNGTCKTTWPITPPVGSNAQVQFNNWGVFGASSNLVWDNINWRLGIGTSTPAYTLDVVGDMNVQNDLSTDSDLYVYGPKAYFSGDVGIGTSTPAYDLDVNGTINVNGNWLFAAGIFVGNSTSKFDGSVGIGTTPWANMFKVNGTSSFSGDVGIGTTTPAYELDVNGSIHTNGNWLFDAGIFVGNSTSLFDGSLGIGTTPWINKFKVNGNSSFSGNVGIGTNTPAYTLDVNGTGSFKEICLLGDCRNVWPSWWAGTPAGSNTQVQFNNAWVFGASPNLVWNNTNWRLGIGITPTENLTVSGTFSVTHNSAWLNAVGWGAQETINNASSSLYECPNNGVMKWVQMFITAGYLELKIKCSND